MRKRRWQWVAGGLLVTLLGTAAAWLLLSRGPQIDPASYDRIMVGMTTADVEAIIGAPSGDYSSRKVTSFVMLRNDRAVPKSKDGFNESVWVGRTHVIAVEFDDDYRVVGKDIGEVQDPPWWDRLLAMFGIR